MSGAGERRPRRPDEWEWDEPPARVPAGRVTGVPDDDPDPLGHEDWYEQPEP